jgi:hypothetical protein
MISTESAIFAEGIPTRTIIQEATQSEESRRDFQIAFSLLSSQERTRLAFAIAALTKLHQQAVIEAE